MSISIPADIFYNRLQRMKQVWKKDFELQLDSIILINGKPTKNNEKTIAIVGWLLSAYNLTDTIFIFDLNEVVIYSSEKKIKYLKQIKESEKAEQFNVTVKVKGQNGAEIYSQIWKNIHGGLDIPKVGEFPQDEKKGTISEDFKKFMESAQYTPMEASQFFNECLLLKFEDQILNIKKSSLATVYFYEKFTKQIQKVLDSGVYKMQSQICRKIQELLNNEAQLQKCATKVTNSNEQSLKIEKECIDVGPCIKLQSGGEYLTDLLKFPVDMSLRCDCILVNFGMMYKGYNSFVGRTLLINMSQKQKETYKKCLTIFQTIIKSLEIGETLQSVFQKVAEKMEDCLPHVKIPESFGTGIGIFFCEDLLQINYKNKRKIQAGESFIVNLTIDDLQQNEKPYAIQIIDTVIVTEKGVQNLTQKIGKSLTDICYLIESEDKKTRYSQKSTIITESDQRLTRRASKHQETMEKLKNIKIRTEHQEKLKLKKYDELKQKGKDYLVYDEKKPQVIDCSRIQCYQDGKDISKSIPPNEIHLDAKRNTILLPINGKHVPFHLYLVKNVAKNEEGSLCSLRFNFVQPQSPGNLVFPKIVEPMIFVKELVYRSQNKAKFAIIEKQIKALQKKLKTSPNNNEKQNVLFHEQLKFNKGKKPILQEIIARPMLGGKKMKGILQCHYNGFRYVNKKQDVVQIPFSKIKYAFFQPCEKQMVATIHFRLSEPIMVGKKKTQDIQFFMEGGKVYEDLKNNDDESDDEEHQKQMRRLLDKEIKQWIFSCEEYTDERFEFQTPNRKTGFYGNVFRHNSLIQSTRNCLINVIESPFFICPLKDIEVVCFERVFQNSKSFDITIVMKDYQNFMKINSIQIKDIQLVKDWLDSQDIIFYDHEKTLRWPKFLSEIRKDFQSFIADGGWTTWDETNEEQSLEDESFSDEALSESSDSSSEYDEESESNGQLQELSDEVGSDEELEDITDRSYFSSEKREKKRESKVMRNKKK